ncbi:unnamed protein product [Paramecium primaurelia]|uniref:NACHT domain-containing protein n=1 Tax=Paramecium primaurelia TaxID=5886 RepID=A0A8S1QMN9_PARPR|nr:unnamed protein product [Paramecium primaurelia]
MLSLVNTKISSLRGGGCGSFRMNPRTYENLQSDIQDIDNFITKFSSFVEIICAKADVAINSIESQEIMIAIQWFIFQEENIYKLNKNPQNIMKSYNPKIIEKLLDLYQKRLITVSLSKVIFSFHVMNSDRIMNFDLQKEFFDISDDLKQQIEIEKNDLIQVQMEVYLFLTKTSFEIVPNNNHEREDIRNGFASGIFGSLIQLKPNAELIESLFKAVRQIHKIHTIKKNRKQYEVYFQIEMLQWEIISFFRHEKQVILKEILLKIQRIYENLVKRSNNWQNHFLWIQMVGKILIFNPLLTKQRLNHQFYVNVEGISEKKNTYLNESYNDQAVIILSQLQKNKLIQLDRQVLEDSFKGWEEFLILKQFFIGELNEDTPFTFSSYLKCKFDFFRKDSQKKEKILTIEKMKMLLSFIIPTKLINLIKQNNENLREVIQVQKQFRENEQVNKRLLQSTIDSQLKKIICNQNEYSQNTQKILKIFQLNQNNKYYQTEQLQQADKLEFNILFQLKYLMKLLEEILLQAIQEIKNQRNQFCKQDSINDEIIILQQQKELIQEQLKNLNLKDNQFSFVNKLQQQLLDLLIATLDQKSFLKKAERILRLIEDSKNQILRLEIMSLKKCKYNECFQSLLNHQYFEQDHMVEKFKKMSMNLFQYELESVYEFGEIQQQISNMLSFYFLYKLRLNNLKLQLQLNALKESFQNIVLAQLEEFQQLQKVIDLNEFLVNVINNYPKKKYFAVVTIFYKEIIAELTSMQITEQDYQNKLSKQKGILEYLILVLSLEEQLIDLEKIDLELIDKEFGEFFQGRILFFLFNRQNYDNNRKCFNLKFNKNYRKILAYVEIIKIVEKNYSFNNIENVKQLINHIEKVVELLKNSQDQNQKIIQNDHQQKQNNNDEIFTTDNNLNQEEKFLKENQKQKVLKEAENKNVRSIYVPIKTLGIFHKLEKLEKKVQLNDLEVYKEGHQEGHEEEDQEGNLEEYKEGYREGHEEEDQEGNLEEDEEGCIDEELNEEGYKEINEGDEKEKTSILMNFQNLYDKNGEINEFLLDGKETVLLIHGVAGQGKSTAAKKIEELIWKLHDNNQKIGNKLLIPTYISLPSLKNPVFQAVEEAIHQDHYGFDLLQLKECKEMLEKKDFRFLLIMDSYDEMKLENIQKNLYINNKLKQNWSNPLVIFTTRSEQLALKIGQDYVFVKQIQKIHRSKFQRFK